MANRNREVKIRLSDAEYKFLQRSVKDTGLSLSKYIRNKILSTLGVPLFSCNRKIFDTFMELELIADKKVIGYMSCSYEYGECLTRINSLYVIQAYRGIDIEDALLKEATDFALQHHSKTIVAFPGTEPYCPDKMPSAPEQIAWYEKHGYIHDHDVCGVIPCMIKSL